MTCPGWSSDLGAAIGSRADERQASIQMRATALAGSVMCAVAVAGFAMNTALGGTTWPFALFSAIGAASLLAGSVIYRADG